MVLTNKYVEIVYSLETPEFTFKSLETFRYQLNSVPRKSYI